MINYRSSFAKLIGASALAAAAGSAVLAASPGTDGGRYSMSPVDGGFVRLDKQTGAMAFCKADAGSWKCTSMEADSSAAAAPDDEVAKLKDENDKLKEELRRMEDVFGLDEKKKVDGGRPGPLEGPPGGPLPKFKLPSEAQVDEAIDYLEGMIRKFRERFEDFGDKTDPDRSESDKPDAKKPDATPEGPTRL